MEEAGEGKMGNVGGMGREKTGQRSPFKKMGRWFEFAMGKTKKARLCNIFNDSVPDNSNYVYYANMVVGGTAL